MKGKLVRDRIPDIIAKNEGKRPRTKVLPLSAYRQELLRKLLEESHEVVSAKTKEHIVAEIADVEEVLEAIKKAAGISSQKVAHIKTKKKKERGGFNKRIFLIE